MENVSPKHDIDSTASDDARRNKKMKISHNDTMKDSNEKNTLAIKPIITKQHMLSSKDPKTSGDTTPTDTGSAEAAAERVFGLPELLEQILVERGKKAQMAPRWGKPKEPIPVVELFVLQRVNSTFKTTIATSPTLQQLMGLAPMPKADTEEKSLQQRSIWINWLTRELGGFDGAARYIPQEQGDFVTIDIPYDCFFDEDVNIFKRPHMLRSTAWRSMPLSLTSETDERRCGEVQVTDQ